VSCSGLLVLNYARNTVCNRHYAGKVTGTGCSRDLSTADITRYVTYSLTSPGLAHGSELS